MSAPKVLFFAFVVAVAFVSKAAAYPLSAATEQWSTATWATSKMDQKGRWRAIRVDVAERSTPINGRKVTSLRVLTGTCRRSGEWTVCEGRKAGRVVIEHFRHEHEEAVLRAKVDDKTLSVDWTAENGDPLPGHYSGSGFCSNPGGTRQEYRYGLWNPADAGGRYGAIDLATSGRRDHARIGTGAVVGSCETGVVWRISE